MRYFLALFVWLAACEAAAAQGCGPNNPNCVVPTAPAGTCDSRAASTLFACNAISGGTTPGTARDIPIYNSGGTGFVDSTVNMPSNASAVLYASPTGSDVNNSCLSSGSPCTLMGACSARTQIATYLSGNFVINLASGTYSVVDANNALCSILGNTGGSAPTLTTIYGAGGQNGGTCTSQTLTVLAVPASAMGVYVKDNGETGVHCLEITGGNSSVGIQNAGQAAVSDYDNVTWGAWGTGGSHVAGTDGSYINLNANGETVTANVAIHWNISGTARLNAGGVTTITGTPAWSTAFANAGPMSRLDISSWSFSGSSTGVRFSGTGPGYINTAANAACNSVMPGNSACSFQLGFQDGNGDGSTGSGPTVYQNAPTIEDQIIWPHTYAGLPASPTAGQFSHIVDGLAANCNDSLCVTPGTAVTAGGGSLDLWLKYDTTWRLVAAQAIPNATKFNGYGSGVATALADNTNSSGGFPTVPVANAQLANASTTVQGQTCTLGASCTVVTAGTGIGVTGTAVASNGQIIEKFSPGQLAAVVNTKGSFTKWTKAATVDNLEGSATSFTCSGNPTITFFECGTSTTCASSPTTIGTVTVTTSGTVVDGTVSNPAITAGDYTAWAVTAGTCTAFDIVGSANIHSN